MSEKELEGKSEKTASGGIKRGKRAGLQTRFSYLAHRAEKKAGDSSRKRDHASAYTLRIVVHVLRQWARDRCPQQAASLAFQTLLSVVPAIAVGFSILRLTGSSSAESSLVDFLATSYIPVSADEITGKLLGWSDNINFQTLGLVGFSVTLLIAFLMFNSLDRIISFIWRVEKKRAITQKLIVFYATVTILPFFLGLLFHQGSKIGLTSGAIAHLTNFFFIFGAIYLINLVLPYCHVRHKSALIGAMVSTILFQLAHFLFQLYVTEVALEKYSGIYGAAAVFPLWLLWIYYSWLTLLLGIEFAHAAQNMHLFSGAERRGNTSLENELMRCVNGPVAARMMVFIARNYIRDGKATPRIQLEEFMDLSPAAVNRLVLRLKESNLVVSVSGEITGILPAIPPNEIPLCNILKAFRDDDRSEKSMRRPKTRLEDILKDLHMQSDEKTKDIFLDELV